MIFQVVRFYFVGKKWITARSQAPPATRRLELWHTDQTTHLIKHARETVWFDSNAQSYLVRQKSQVRLTGAILWYVSQSFAPQCRCSPKLPEGASSANVGTRVKRHFAVAGDTSVRVFTSARLSSASSDLSSPQWAAGCAPFISTHRNRCAHTHRHRARSPPPPPHRQPHGGRSEISLNKEASGDRQLQRPHRGGGVGGRRRGGVLYTSVIWFLYKPQRLIPCVWVQL